MHLHRFEELHISTSLATLMPVLQAVAVQPNSLRVLRAFVPKLTRNGIVHGWRQTPVLPNRLAKSGGIGLTDQLSSRRVQSY